MSATATPDAAEDRNHVTVDPKRCKGCGVCIVTCPKECLVLGSELNRMGYP